MPILREFIQLRGLIVHHILFIEDDQVTLIDGGFFGGVRRIRRALAARGLDFSHVSNLILTHGHLDHTLNAARIHQLSRCRISAPQLDRDHLEGTHHYQGWSRVCGWLQSLGRFALRYTPPVVDEWFDDQQVLSGGLQVVALPGHTVGHCGFYDPVEELLIAGDLFTNHLGRPKQPPRIFNDDHDEALRSITKAARLHPKKVILNHSKKSTPEEAAAWLQALARLLPPLPESIDHPPHQSRKQRAENVESDDSPKGT